MYTKIECIPSQIAKFMGPTWGPTGSCRPQMSPMLAPWTLLLGMWINFAWCNLLWTYLVKLSKFYQTKDKQKYTPYSCWNPNSMMAWISNHLHCFVWDVITHSCPTFNLKKVVEVRSRMGNYIYYNYWWGCIYLSMSSFWCWFSESLFITRDSEVIMFSPCVFVCVCLCLSRCLSGRFNYEGLVPHKQYFAGTLLGMSSCASYISHTNDVTDDVTRSQCRSIFEIDISPSIFELEHRSKAQNIGNTNGYLSGIFNFRYNFR